MMEHYGILGIAISAVMTVYAFVLRRQLLETKALLSDASMKYQSNVKLLKSLEEKGATQEKKYLDLSVQIQKQEQQKKRKEDQIDQVREEIATLKEKYEKDLELQKDHFSEEKGALVSQIEEALASKREALEKIDQLKKEFRESNRADEFKKQVKNKESELRSAQQEAKKLKIEVQKQSEAIEKMRKALLANRRIKARHAKLETLYKSMKGLKELTEERNQNWEKALRLLAQATLSSSTTPANSEQTQSLGTLVTSALERIGAQLVIDEHTIKPDADKTSPAPDDQNSYKVQTDSFDSEVTDDKSVSITQQKVENITEVSS